MSLSEAAAAFRRGLAQPVAALTATPEERLVEAVRLYDWQIRDLSQRLRNCTDPGEAARLHARITDARAKLDATQALLSKQGGDVSAHPDFARAIGQYIEVVSGTLEDAAGVGLDVADIPPEHVERVLRAARDRLDARLATLATASDVNALDAPR